MLDVLSLELLAFGVVCPGEALVGVDATVRQRRDEDGAPTDSLDQKAAHKKATHRS